MQLKFDFLYLSLATKLWVNRKNYQIGLKNLKHHVEVENMLCLTSIGPVMAARIVWTLLELRSNLFNDSSTSPGNKWMKHFVNWLQLGMKRTNIMCKSFLPDQWWSWHQALLPDDIQTKYTCSLVFICSEGSRIEQHRMRGCVDIQTNWACPQINDLFIKSVIYPLNNLGILL